MIERITEWFRGRPVLLDRLFAGTLTALVVLSIVLEWESLGNFKGPIWVAGLCWIITPITLFWRRNHPIQVLSVMAVVGIVEIILDIDSSPSTTMIPLGMYALGAHTKERRQSVIAAGTFLLIALLALLIGLGSEVGELVASMVVFAIGWVVGDNVRTRRAYSASLLERAERAEELRDSLARQAVIEERTHIARELHDVVAHSMSIMVVQASAARRVVHTDPTKAEEAIRAIENNGRDSLNEMRRILGVLRSDRSLAEMAPQPQIAEIGSILADVRTAGLPVTYRTDGEVRPLSPSVELTVYRLVQESLTNALKHAGPARAQVTLTYRTNELQVEISDDGRGVLGESPGGAQKGLVGLRERVEAFDGTFEAEPAPGGGFRVLAIIPVPDIPPTSASTTGGTAADGPTLNSPLGHQS